MTGLLTAHTPEKSWWKNKTHHHFKRPVNFLSSSGGLSKSDDDDGYENRRPQNNSYNQEKMRGQRGRLTVQPLGYVMSTKVIFRRAEVFVLAEACLPRRPHAF